MPLFIWRILIALILALFLFAALPLLLGVLQLTVPHDALALVKLCIGVGLLLYVIFGKWPGTAPF